MTEPDSTVIARNAEHDAAVKTESASISGRWVVIGMFAFAVTAVSILYAYWHLHRAPFLELQKALATRFPDSRPLVEGGQHKAHKKTPMVLRVTMEVTFNPQSDLQRRGSHSNAVIDLLEARDVFTGYENFELNLFWPEPEQRIVQVGQTFAVTGSTVNREPTRVELDEMVETDAASSSGRNARQKASPAGEEKDR